MKLQLLCEDINLDRIASRVAKSSVEKAGWSKNGREFTGNRTSVSVSKNDFSGIQWHTHPVAGVPTPIGALPSIEDLQSAVYFMIRTGHDRFNPKGQTVINDPSGDVEMFAIIHGPYVFEYIPGPEVDLSYISKYTGAIEEGDWKKALNVLKDMGFGQFKHNFEKSNY